ncbi:MAG: fructosamine kinase family protein [Puniceicoccales bacterium]
MASLADLLENALGRPVDINGTDSVGGGCIHDSRRLATSAGLFFLKQSPLSQRPLLEAEAEGLRALARTRTIRTPAVIASGAVGEHFALILEWIDLSPLDESSGAVLGEHLADLHESGREEQFGWERDNFIGSTPQQNSPTSSWPEFFREHRLRPQIQLAGANGYSLPPADPLLEGIGRFFRDSDHPVPSPLHGDLWGGNAARDESGTPVLFDPAFYRGDPEADIAFSRFFGGFPDSFYRSYNRRIPQRPGWKTRQTLYNLYHVLNHLNLFGSSYRSGAIQMIQELNTAVKENS